MSVRILGTPVSQFGFQELVQEIRRRVESQKGGMICFGNAHNLVEGKLHSSVAQALAQDLTVADGKPVVWVSRLLGRPIGSRCCGPDVMKAVLDLCTEKELQGWIGGTPGQAEKVTKLFRPRAICYSPPFRPFNAEHAREDWAHFLSLCPENATPSIVWVGLGAPKQELWMSAVAPIAPNTLFLGVGAAYDFLSGTKPRAPLWMQDNGLEWLYRFATEPRRLWKRYLVGNSLFIFYSLGDLLRYWLFAIRSK